MAKYNVEMTKIPWLEIGKSPVIFHIRQGEVELGVLRIRKGHIVWIPARSQLGYWMDWNKFGKVAVKNGKRRPIVY